MAKDNGAQDRGAHAPAMHGQGDLHDLQLSLDAMATGVVILDPDLNTTFINRACLDIWNITPRDVPVGGPFRALMDAQRDSGGYDLDDEEWENYVAARLDRIRQGDVTPRELRRADGRSVIFSVTPLTHGKRLVAWHDVTEARRCGEALEEAQRGMASADRVKSEFLANMSHEIRTPMNGVLGMADLLSKSDLDARQKTFVDIIVKSGNALLTMITDILDFSRIDAGQLTLHPVPFSLTDAIGQVVTLACSAAREKNLELVVRVQPGLHDHYIGDVGRLRQILANLVGNAIRFTDAGHALVDISGEDEGVESALRVAVTDTGIGIPQDMLARLFDSFTQVDSSPARRHEGTGLGLAITSRLVALMGGEIDVQSREGEGSTFSFTIRLPRAEATRKEPVMPVDLADARVLIIDDNAASRAIIMEQMTNWGFDACAARNGGEGLTVLKTMAALGLRLDCLILDCRMNETTGMQMAHAMRATPQTAGAPVIVLTGTSQPPGQATCKGLVIDRHLVKPARPSVLLETMVSAIRESRAGAAGDDMATGRNDEAPGRDIVQRVDGHRVDVLIAEDNEVNQLVFAQILNETGLTYEIVDNGRLAVEACRTMRPRMVLMDVSMPQMDGLEATAHIRRAEAATGRRIPIVGVTAHALKGDEERCLEAGMDDYLSKPVSPQMLTQKIGRWIGFTATKAGTTG